jgi:hypothetical protein
MCEQVRPALVLVHGATPTGQVHDEGGAAVPVRAFPTRWEAR